MSNEEIVNNDEVVLFSDWSVKLCFNQALIKYGILSPTTFFHNAFPQNFSAAFCKQTYYNMAFATDECIEIRKTSSY